MKNKHMTLCLLFFIAFSAYADAEVINLKNGTIVTGRVVGMDENAILIKTKLNTITIYKDKISSMNSSKAAEASDKDLLSRFNTVVVIPFNANNTLVEEEKYASLPKQIAAQATESLKDRLSHIESLNKIVIGGDCTDGAIKIESRIITLSHYMGRFYVAVKGKVYDCATEGFLFEFEFKLDDRSASSFPEDLARKISNRVERMLNL